MRTPLFAQYKRDPSAAAVESHLCDMVVIVFDTNDNPVVMVGITGFGASVLIVTAEDLALSPTVL